MARPIVRGLFDDARRFGGEAMWLRGEPGEVRLQGDMARGRTEAGVAGRGGGGEGTLRGEGARRRGAGPSRGRHGGKAAERGLEQGAARRRAAEAWRQAVVDRWQSARRQRFGAVAAPRFVV